MIPHISIVAFLSDPLMIAGATLIVVGMLVFFIAFLKWVTFKTPPKERLFIIPHEDTTEPIAEPEPLQEEEPDSVPTETHHAESIVPIPAPEEKKPAVTKSSAESSDERTVVIPPQEAAASMQMDIVVSQIKNLNKKVSDLEFKLDQAELQGATEASNATQQPVGDLSQKLLKLAEHVIHLEREVSKLKATIVGTPAAPPQGSKPPVMPI